MSFCSHQLLDWDSAIQRYRCADCPSIFEARLIGRDYSQDEKQPKEDRREPVRVLPIVGIVAALIFGLAVLAMAYKTWGPGSVTHVTQKECPDISKWQREAQQADALLSVCLNKEPETRIVEVPVEVPGECTRTDECTECQETIYPKICPKTYKDEFQACMDQRGQAIYSLEQCQANAQQNECAQKECNTTEIALRACNRKTEELRGWISTLTLRQGGSCPDVAVRGCEREIEAACGNLRRALEFYFDKSKSQPGGEDGDGVDLPPMWKPGPVFGADEDLELSEDEIEWD
jgi:hypothetical protein